MEQQKNKKRKILGNKGFSLVELIVVIAIMAILTGFVAPQVMKYVQESRKAADDRNIEGIKNAIELALVDEDAYNNAKNISATPGFSFIIAGAAPTKTTDNEDLSGAFMTELTEVIGEWPSAKQNSKNFLVTIDANLNVSVALNP